MNKFTIQKSFAISAGAGSGKTYTLSRRYINALLGFDYFREDYATQDSCFEVLKPAKVSQIVTITYTEAAALEMKGRIFELVHKIINLKHEDPADGDSKSIIEANSHLTEEQQIYVVDTLSKAYMDSSNSKISTIHAYCLNIIKANSDIARIDTKLDIIKEDTKQSELSKIIFDVLNDAGNKEMILDISSDISMFFVNNLIAKYVSNSKFRKDYDSFKKESIDIETYKQIIMELYPLPDIADALNEVNSDGVRTSWLNTYYQNFLNFCAVDWKNVSPDEKTPSLGAKKYPYTTAVKEELDKLVKPYSQIDIQKENCFFEKIEKIKTMLHQIKARYDEKLKELGKIDFDSIITKTLEIMPLVKTNYKYIMVDEFQDTNEIQFEIVRSSMNIDTNLFVVGDSKQSIYAFQGAEIEVFNNAVQDTNLFSSIEDMSKNHRSDGAVLETINRIFDSLLKKNEHLRMVSQNYEADPQDLEVFKNPRKEQGSFKFLITSQDYQQEANELDSIADFISQITNHELKEYHHISQLIGEKKKAIAVVFDSSSKMLELKLKLRARGITAKVSASDNFYHTKEVNDVFNTLQAVYILSKEPHTLSEAQKYYVVGAMRSNVLRIDDNSIKKHLDNKTLPQKLEEYIEQYLKLPLAELVKYIYDDSNILGVYAHLDDVEQRAANLYKFLLLCKEYQDSGESSLYRFLQLLENSIYFSEAKEDEAFFKSDNTKSIEICSIHSTKGLAYPLVLLANSDKGLYSQITSDSLKHNNFTLNGKKKEIVGFKINNYEPLSMRVLKEIDKLKHLAEKKRLLYVALTRAEHDVVISAKLSAKKEGDISLREDSYLAMIINALGISKDELFHQDKRCCLHVKTNTTTPGSMNKKLDYVPHSWKPLEFAIKEKISATNGNLTHDETAAKLGTSTHKIFELYWKMLDQIDIEDIFLKFNIDEDLHKTQIQNSIEKFLASEVYRHLKSGAKHRFELEFHTENKTGFIDLVYFDNQMQGWVVVDFKTGKPSEKKEQYYLKQLDFYKSVLASDGLQIVGTELLWV
ncbi:MAG: UvrD-helicase domain-containing protein [Epsilonproteobacteria bacterium]|nr:UvrD-helicase domain-containing protein [Campylobacterota bacterium]